MWVNNHSRDGKGIRANRDGGVHIDHNSPVTSERELLAVFVSADS
jgi:hypothetical protein